jgi:hypothetical protein
MFMPRRLIKIDDRGPQLSLVDRPLEAAPYCALSYCWGDDRETLKTTKANLADHYRGWEIDRMPKVSVA